jgi:hypothetical protein
VRRAAADELGDALAELCGQARLDRARVRTRPDDAEGAGRVSCQPAQVVQDSGGDDKGDGQEACSTKEGRREHER